MIEMKQRTAPDAQTGKSPTVTAVDFARAFYIKLGRGGAWEEDSIHSGKLRIGWRHQSLDDINKGRWSAIECQLRTEHEGKPGVATTDLNRLREISESTTQDIWIAFHQSKLWWTRLASGPVKEDRVSKFRRTAIPWSDRDVKGRLLVGNDLPGRITQLQGFRGTVCRVKERDLLKRVLDGSPSPIARAIATQRASLAEQLRHAISDLHWKDFETLVDLVFRDAGWIRVSVLGQQAKGYDLELREPITGDRYVVQVKSKADLRDLQTTTTRFSNEDYRRVFFVVHSPASSLAAPQEIPGHVELVGPERLAERVIDAGLVSWLEDKVW